MNRRHNRMTGASWQPPLEQTDPAARRVAWVLYCFAAVLVAGLIAYGCAS